MPPVSVLSSLIVAGAIVLDRDEAEFPENPQLGTMVIKGQALYVYVYIGGVLAWYPIVKQPTMYTHTQVVPMAEWEVTHNLGSNNTWAQVQDVNDQLVFPAEIVYASVNTMLVRFAEAVAGKVLVLASDAGTATDPVAPVVPQASIFDVVQGDVVVPVERKTRWSPSQDIALTKLMLALSDTSPIDLVFDILKNGQSVFTSGNYPILPAGQSQVKIALSNIAVTPDDYVTFAVLQGQGSNLTWRVDYKATSATGGGGGGDNGGGEEPPVYSVLFSDAFNGQGMLIDHTPDVGAAWDFGSISSTDGSDGVIDGAFYIPNLPRPDDVRVTASTPFFGVLSDAKAEMQFVVPSDTGTFADVTLQFAGDRDAGDLSSIQFWYSYNQITGQASLAGTVYDSQENYNAPFYLTTQFDGLAPLATDVAHSMRLEIKAGLYRWYLNNELIYEATEFNWMTGRTRAQMLIAAYANSPQSFHFESIEIGGTVVQAEPGTGGGGTTPSVPYGFIAGGDNNGYGELYASIEGINFDTDTMEQLSMSLDVANTNLRGVSGPNAGYLAGGATENGNPFTIQKLDYSTSSISMLSEVRLPQTGSEGAAVSTPDAGYIGGGYSPFAQLVPSIDKFDFATESIQSLSVNLSALAHQYAAAFRSEDHGFWLGGIDASQVYSDAITSLGFADDAATVLGATLSRQKAAFAAASSPNEGVMAGGFGGMDAGSAEFEAFNFNSQTSSIVAAVLDNPKAEQAGTESSANGYFAGGLNKGPDNFDLSTQVDLWSFADGSHDISGAVLGIGRRGHTAFAGHLGGEATGGGGGSIGGAPTDFVDATNLPFVSEFFSVSSTENKWYRIELTEATPLNIDTMLGDAGSDTSIAIWDANGELLGQNDDNEGIDNTYRSALSFPELPPGVYWIACDSYPAQYAANWSITHGQGTAGAVIRISQTAGIPTDSGGEGPPPYDGPDLGMGYIVGGQNDAGTNQAGMEAFNFGNETFMPMTGVTLPQTVVNAGAMSGTSNGLIAGGYTSDASNGYLATIDSLDFPTASVSTEGASLSQARYAPATMSGPDHGYVAGGHFNDTGSMVTPGTSSTVVDKYDFAQNTCTVVGTALSQPVDRAAGFGSQTNGYVAGGINEEAHVLVGDIVRLEYSTDTVSAVSESLSQAKQNLAATESTTTAFIGGGVTDDEALDYWVNRIETMESSTESMAISSSTLSEPTAELTTVKSATDGYFVGGYSRTTGVLRATADRLSFSNESVATVSSQLTEGLLGAAGMSSMHLPDFMLGGGGGGEPPAPTGQRFVLDTFTGFDGDNLTNHVGEVGATWSVDTTISDQPLADMILNEAGGYVAGTGNGGSGYTAAIVPSGMPDGESFAIELDFEAVGYAELYLGWGCNSADDKKYEISMYPNPDGTEIDLYKRDERNIGMGYYYSDTNIVNGNGQHTLRVEVNGSAVRILLDAVEVHTATDAGTALPLANMPIYAYFSNSVPGTSLNLSRFEVATIDFDTDTPAPVPA